VPKISLKLEIVIMWLNTIDHIQVASSPEAEDAMLFFYSKVLGLTEIDKPETIKDNKGLGMF
jgi:4-hydroxyphenylpyruvate dioxygenase-like putative hemolysin